TLNLVNWNVVTPPRRSDLAPEQRLVLRMALDVLRDERAARNDLPVLGSGLFQHRFGERAPQAATLELLRHFGVREEDRIPPPQIRHERGVSVELRLEPVLLWIVHHDNPVLARIGHRALSF